MWHITEKGFQLGACIGSAVVVPVMLYRGRGSNVPVLPKLLRGLAKTTVITTGVTGNSHRCVCFYAASFATENIQK